jgi:hypothetical protein
MYSFKKCSSEGISSGLAKDFNSKKHLEMLKASKKRSG